MVFLAAYNPNLLLLVAIVILILIPGLILKKLKQPYVIAYIFAGIFIGKHGFGLITDEQFITQMGDFGLILLLFFIGMEISLPDLLSRWKTATFGVLFQVLGSIFLIWIVGNWLGWGMNRIVMLGFVISLSSSAVVIKLLQDAHDTQSSVGQNVISILLMQDIIIVPMLIATNYLGGQKSSPDELIMQIIGGVLLIVSMIWLVRKKHFKLPFSRTLEKDHELGVFFAALICFSFALITAFLGLSAALGAFVGGIFVHAARSTEWIHGNLHAFRVVFVALFFISVGMLIDLNFLKDNFQVILLLLSVIFVANHFLNGLILKSMGNTIGESIYGGALLAQIGELSFVVAAVGFHTGIIQQFSYQITIAVTALSLLISPFWISLTKRFVDKK